MFKRDSTVNRGIKYYSHLSTGTKVKYNLYKSIAGDIYEHY